MDNNLQVEFNWNIQDKSFKILKKTEHVLIDIIKNNLPKASKKAKFSKCILSINVVNSKKMREINLSHRNKDKPTDVLSFPFNEIVEDTLDFGDMFINSDDLIVMGESMINFMKFFTHCYLHLIGYDHQTDSDYNKMMKLEDSIYKKYISKWE